MEAASVSEVLAKFVSAASWEDVAAQSHEAKRSILNFFATGLGSADDPAVTDVHTAGERSRALLARRLTFR